MLRLIVAIDGPAGSGKSTSARGLAARLGYDFLDTGAIYRALALFARRSGVPWDDGAALANLAEALDLRFVPDGGANRVLIGDVDVTADIRSPEIGEGASRVSALPAVRTALLGVQRRLGVRGGVVAEGRDVGTVVFPEAGAKFFLVAEPPVRARRRAEELRAGGRQVDVAETLRQIEARDRRDSSREVAPLRKAPDAVEIDSTALTPEEVVDAMIALVRQRGG